MAGWTCDGLPYCQPKNHFVIWTLRLVLPPYPFDISAGCDMECCHTNYAYKEKLVIHAASHNQPNSIRMYQKHMRQVIFAKRDLILAKGSTGCFAYSTT